MTSTNESSKLETFKCMPHEVYQQVVNDIAKMKNLSDNDKYEINYSAASSKGDNYVGLMYRIVIKCKKDNSIKLSLIAKLPPQNEARRNEFLANVAFQREIQFYDVIFPLYKKFQQEKNIDVDSEGFYEAPVCYKTLTSEPHEAIFLEDLKFKNFEMYDRFKDVTKEHVILVMKALAKMHATFLCLKDQKPELIESLRDIEDYFRVHCKSSSSLFTGWCEGQKIPALKLLEKCDNADMKKKIKAFLKMSALEMLDLLTDGKSIEPYSTVCHGDVWNNNMMFKNDENGTPVRVCLLDFQIMRYSSPIVDVVHYIFVATTKELRDKHYQEFLDVYYDTLSSFIRKLNSDPEKVYPNDVFKSHLKKYGSFGLFLAFIALPAQTCDPESAPDMDAISESFQSNENKELNLVKINQSEKSLKKYEERMKGVFEDIYNLGYL